MSAIAPNLPSEPWRAPELASWGARDLDALRLLRPGAVTLVKVEAGAGAPLLRHLARDARSWDEAGLVRGAPFRLEDLPAALATVSAPLILIAGLTDAALREDDGRALLLDALAALREAAIRLDAPVVIVERARRLSSAHPLRGVVDAEADEIVTLRRGGLVELPSRGAQLRVEA